MNSENLSINQSLCYVLVSWPGPTPKVSDMRIQVKGSSGKDERNLQHLDEKTIENLTNAEEARLKAGIKFGLTTGS